MLRAWGVGYLVGLNQTVDSPNMEWNSDQQSVIVLIQRVAECDEYPRVRDALISLLLLHPELAQAVQRALQESEPKVAGRIATLTLATLYLQRLWSFRLTIAFGHFPGFPEQPFTHLWEERHLPLPALYNGAWGLRALEKFEQKRVGFPFTFTGDWQNQVDRLLWQEESKHHPVEVVLRLPEEEAWQGQELGMSIRPGVDKAAIDAFLQQLGRAFRKPARLYLVGGAALVHMGVRSGLTEDIDVQASGENEGELIVAIQRLKERLQMNVVFASPGDFIPLPAEWEMHARFVGRYGTIDVFYFDFYSIALSKIERGNSRDLADVNLLVQQGIITVDELDKAYREVLAQLGKGKYPRVTPRQFRDRYQVVRRLL